MIYFVLPFLECQGKQCCVIYNRGTLVDTMKLDVPSGMHA